MYIEHVRNEVVQGATGLYSIVNNGKQLTNVNLQKYNYERK